MGTVSFTLGKDIAHQINGMGSALARVAFNQSGATETLSVMVGPNTAVPEFWTSVFGLQCGASGANQATLLAPNFTVTPTTTIDVRPWLAWYPPRPGGSGWVPKDQTQVAGSAGRGRRTALPNGTRLRGR